MLNVQSLDTELQHHLEIGFFSFIYKQENCRRQEGIGRTKPKISLPCVEVLKTLDFLLKPSVMLARNSGR